MRLLVTGHEGYIGSALIPLLRADGHEVIGLDAGWFTDCDFGAAPSPVPTLRLDIRDVTSDHCVGFDAVVHLAAISNDPLGDINPSVTYDINYHGAVRLARAARTAGVPRFLFASSCSLYGAGGDDWVDESVSYAPITPYGESKVLAERRIAALADGEFSPVFLRHATAYGITPRLRGDLLLNNLVAFAVTSGRLVLQSDPGAWRPMVHVTDIARAYRAILATDPAVWHNRAYHVGRVGEDHRVGDIADLVCSMVPGSRIEVHGGSGDDRSYRVDCSRIEAEIPAFQPQWTVQKGVEELSAAYRAEGLLLPEFEDRYLRIRRIRRMQAEGVLDGRLRRGESMRLSA